jgi:hypothetical protein
MMTLRIRCLWKSGLKLLGPKVLSAALFLLFAASVPAGDVDVDLTVTNDGTTNIFVTLYDMSANPPHVTVMHHERINGFTSVPISVSADSNGRANVYWTATSVDSFSRKCGRGATGDLNNNAAVKVQANSSCGD